MNSGTEFPTMTEAKEAIRAWITEHHFPYKIKSSCRMRYIVGCVDVTCSFRISCALKKSGIVRISTCQKSHTCNELLTGKLRGPTSKWTAKAVKALYADVPNATPANIRSYCKRHYGVDVQYAIAWRASKIITGCTNEDYIQSFGMIQPYFEKLKELMPGTVAVVDEEEGKYYRAFLCLKPCQESFQHMLPLISFDACHIRNRYNGVILSATVLDGSMQIFLLAFATVPVENIEHWQWFIQNCIQAVPMLKWATIAVLSDREKGIGHAVDLLLPEASHAFCVKHIEKNIKSKFKGVDIQPLWNAAKTMNQSEFVEAMETIRSMHGGVFQYLSSIPASTWAASAFPLPRFGHVTSNISESMNNWIEEARERTPYEMFKFMVKKIGIVIFERKTKYNKMTSDLIPTILNKLKKAIEIGRRMPVTSFSDSLFEVEDGESKIGRVVNLESLECSCGYFQEHKLPCSHVAAVIAEKGLSVENYCAPGYFTATLKAAYQATIIPVDISKLKPSQLLPPSFIPQKGRPKKLRFKSRAELESNSRIICSLCGKRGHNKRTCFRLTKLLADQKSGAELQ